MQINGSSLSTAFPPRFNEARQSVRPPIIIDAEPRPNQGLERPLLPAVTKASPSEISKTLQNDARQEGFVRLFAKSMGSETQKFSESTLPVGVQQYIQIASLDSDSQQRLFDEIV
jgi:hypothetical protein